MSMRRMTLYIDGKPADTTTDSLILLNYTASDLSSPAAVKNTYSQQVTLPATARNDAIFSSIYRADYRTVIGAPTSFNPLIRTPFTIYDETGAILEAGYLKLNTTKNTNGVRTYVATLYGGLGSFFYSLAYDAEGEGLSLGALPLLGDDPTEKVDFRITKEAVAAAWARLKAPTASNAGDRQFDVVNFAPAYNGLPAGEFSADKAIGRPGMVGGEPDHTDNDETYKVYNEVALYDFGGDYTEWETKDLRSYMQRPVASVKALIEGIVRYAAAKGFSVHLDPAWFSPANPYYERAWMTLPLLAGRAVTTVEEGTFDIAGSASSPDTAANTYSFLAVPLGPTIQRTNANVTVKCSPEVITKDVYSANSGSEMWFNAQARGSSQRDRSIGMVVFVQVQLVDANGEVVGASPVKVCLGNTTYNSDDSNANLNARQLVDKAELQGCDPAKGGIDDTLCIGPLQKDFSIPTEDGRPFLKFTSIGEVEVSAYNAVAARVIIEPRALYLVGGPAVLVRKDFQLYCTTSNLPEGGVIYPSVVTAWGGIVRKGTLEYTTSEQYRSGSRVTQEALFADTMSPMEFLLSYTKTFGLHYLYDPAQKRVEILTRNTLYGFRQTVDLQHRIDRSREIATTPIPMTSKWLEFAPANIESEYASYYKTRYGRQYGVQKVNTGFDFDANTTQALDGAKFNGAPEVLERSKYYLYVRNTRYASVPAPTLDGKTTYRLYRMNEDRELQNVELDYPNPTGAGYKGLEYFNANKGYDAVPKLQCHGTDNAGTESTGILLFHRGLASADPSTAGDPTAQQAYRGFHLSDDTADMYTLNEKPCWDLTENLLGVADMPAFGRFDMQGDTIQRSMEFGVPAEIDNPVIAVGNDTSVYERFWAKYIADRNNVDARVCTAYVDLRGFQPGPEMLRDFYYFDGAMWVLNKIANYSLTTPGTTQCEFVKVRDQANYSMGQLLDSSGDYDIRLSLRTDGTDLYVATSRPLEQGEGVVVITRGSGRMAWNSDGPRIYHTSKRRWHLPFQNFTVEPSGKIRIPEYPLNNDYRWWMKEMAGKTYVHIRKANRSRNFGYRVTGDMDKAVTFAVVVVSGKAEDRIEVSNRCYFESRAHVRGGVLTQEFAVTP